MSIFHAHGRKYLQCTRRIEWEDVVIVCLDDVIPGEKFCADCLIATQATRPFPGVTITAAQAPEKEATP